MKVDPKLEEELDVLVGNFFLGLYDSNDLTRLSEILQDNEAARQEFLGLVEIEAELVLLGGKLPESVVVAPVVATSSAEVASETAAPVAPLLVDRPKSVTLNLERPGVALNRASSWFDSSIVRWATAVVGTGLFWVFVLPGWLSVQNKNPQTKSNSVAKPGEGGWRSSSEPSEDGDKAKLPTTEPPYARWVTLTDCRWNGSNPSIGDYAQNHCVYELQTGIAELVVTPGIRVRISAPSRFSVTSRSSISLVHGGLFASVPRDGIGFKVSTPTAVITDLGTEFGVYSELDSKTGVDAGVHVFKGLVSVSLAQDDSGSTSQLLEQGQSSTILRDGSIQSSINSDKLKALESLAHQTPNEEGIDSSVARKDLVAYLIARGPGNQGFNGSLRMDFDTNAAIQITSLGLFDDSQNGFVVGGQVGIFNRSDSSLVGSAVTFGSGLDGSLIGGARYKPTSFTLAAGGKYAIVAVYKTVEDKLSNIVVEPLTSNPFVGVTENSGSGLITFLNTRFYDDTSYGNLVFPTGPDKPGTYAAGSFTFTAVPESSPRESKPSKRR